MSGYTQFVPAELDLLSEGAFMAEAAKAFKELQRAICQYRKEFGDRADGAKAVQTMKVIITAAKGDKNSFTISTSIKSELPARPSMVSLASGGETATDEPCLFVRASGSDSEMPEQTKLVTDDGRVIDHKTGEVKATG